MQIEKFTTSVKAFAETFGTTPPAEAFQLHPAHGSLTEVIERELKPKFKGAKRFLHPYASEAAAHILRGLVLAGCEITDEGATAEELRADLASCQPLSGSPGVNRALDEIAAALIDDTEPKSEPLRMAWQAVRDTPPPDMELMREDAPEWGLGGGARNV